jgi:hypothetical protein
MRWRRFWADVRSWFSAVEEFRLGLHSHVLMENHYHLRVGELGFSKAERPRSRVAAVEAPQAAVVRERIGRLQRHQWSSYRAYAGLAMRP